MVFRYSAGDMIWGAVTAKGLIPSESPIFVSDLFQEYEKPHPKSVNGKMYADMVREKAHQAVLKLYPNGDGIWQDDGAKIHRCPEALEAVDDCFKFRIDPKIQAPKMADFWPIENVWSIVKGKIASKTTNTLQQLKKEIIIAWKEIDSDKDLCRKLVNSIPKRAEAIIKKNGSQVYKDDYN